MTAVHRNCRDVLPFHPKKIMSRPRNSSYPVIKLFCVVLHNTVGSNPQISDQTLLNFTIVLNSAKEVMVTQLRVSSPELYLSGGARAANDILMTVQTASCLEISD